jgi:hypothetical protein
VSAPDLDRWLRDPVIRSHHRREANAPPAALWHAAESVRIGETGMLGRIVRRRIPGLSSQATFRDLFRNHPFCVLEEGDGWSVSGLVGKIWTLEVDYPRLESADQFSTWDAPGTARVLFAHWVDGRTLHSEARVAGTSRSARIRLRALWAVVGPFERLIAGEALALAARRAAGST